MTRTASLRRVTSLSPPWRRESALPAQTWSWTQVPTLTLVISLGQSNGLVKARILLWYFIILTDISTYQHLNTGSLYSRHSPILYCRTVPCSGILARKKFFKSQLSVQSRLSRFNFVVIHQGGNFWRNNADKVKSVLDCFQLSDRNFFYLPYYTHAASGFLLKSLFVFEDHDRLKLIMK